MYSDINTHLKCLMYMILFGYKSQNIYYQLFYVLNKQFMNYNYTNTAWCITVLVCINDRIKF